LKIYLLYETGQRKYISSKLEDAAVEYCILAGEECNSTCNLIKESIEEKGYWTDNGFCITEREYEAF